MTTQDAKPDRGYIFFILPAILIVLGFTLYPALYGVYVSFTNLNFAYPQTSFIGLENYQRLLTWPPLGRVLVNTTVFVGTVVVLQVALGLAIALLLNSALRAAPFFRAVTILPWIIPAVVIAMMFQQMFSGSRLGIMNNLIGMIGLDQRSWLSQPSEAMGVMIGALVWRGTPFSIILLLGGLQTIPKELYEAARIDGANTLQRLRFITLPSLRPILMIALIMVTAGTLNHVDIPLALTGGGPDRATEVLSVTLYQQAFQLLDAGYASAIATAVLVINLALTVVYLRMLNARSKAEA